MLTNDCHRSRKLNKLSDYFLIVGISFLILSYLDLCNIFFHSYFYCLSLTQTAVQFGFLTCMNVVL